MKKNVISLVMFLCALSISAGNRLFQDFEGTLGTGDFTGGGVVTVSVVDDTTSATGNKVGNIDMTGNNEGHAIRLKFPEMINSAEYAGIKFKVYSNGGFHFIFGLRNSQTSTGVQDWNSDKPYAGVGWSEITYNFNTTLSTGNYDYLEILPAAYLQKGAFSFYIDDVALVKKFTGVIQDFEGYVTTGSGSGKDFQGWGLVAASVDSDPVNAGNKVGAFDFSAGQTLGTTGFRLKFSEKISSENYIGIRFKVYSPKTFHFLMKMQDRSGSTTVSQEDWATTPGFTATNEWTIVNYSFASSMQTGEYDHLEMLPASYSTISEPYTFYIDDVELVKKFTGTVQDFEGIITTGSGNDLHSWTPVSASVVEDPVDAKNKVGKIDLNGTTNQGSGVRFKFTEKIDIADYSGLKFKVYSEEKKFNFVFVLYDRSGPTASTVNANVSDWNTKPAVTQLGAWEEITYTLSSALSTGNYNHLDILPATYQNLGAFTFYIDDVRLIKKEASPPTEMNHPSSSAVNIYPAVTSDILNIDIPEAAAVNIYTLTGQLVYQNVLSGSQQISVADFNAKGVLFVQVANAGFSKVQKVIVK
jgi:hypothetical protein